MKVIDLQFPAGKIQPSRIFENRACSTIVGRRSRSSPFPTSPRRESELRQMVGNCYGFGQHLARHQPVRRGRFAINLVNAWNRPELEKAGIGFAEHDDRYAYGREWISVVSRLIGGERITHNGKN